MKKTFVSLLFVTLFLFTQLTFAQIHVDENGKVGIGTTSPTEQLTVSGNAIINGRLEGGFGALSTSGVTNWNDISNIKSGSGPTLLLGNHSNGPSGTGDYFHPFNLEYNSKDGSGNMTQLAIPYGVSGAIDEGIYLRGRYSGSWTYWRKILSQGLRGVVEINNSYTTNNYPGYGIKLYCSSGNYTTYGIQSESEGNGGYSSYAIKGIAKNGYYSTYGIYGSATSSYPYSSTYAGYFDGNVKVTGTVSSASDEKLKENIKDLGKSIDKIKNLKPKTYKFKKNTKLNLPNESQYGLTAQDLEKLFPELVTESNHIIENNKEVKEGEEPEKPEIFTYKSINYTGIIPILIKGMQEQQEMIEDLQKRVEKLESKK